MNPKFLQIPMLILITIISMLLLTSCSLFFTTDNSNQFKNEDYTINFDHDNWDSINSDTADFALLNNTSGSIIMGHSLCKKNSDISLDKLTSNLLAGIHNVIITKKERVKFANREAFLLHATGKVDGVIVLLQLLTLKKDYCTFDFVLIMPKNVFAEDVATFNEFLITIELK